MMSEKKEKLIIIQNRLSECLLILQEFNHKISIFLKEQNAPTHTIPYLIEAILNFVVQCIEVLQQLVLRDSPYYKQSAILARSIFEYSARALWASRIEDGWEKYQAYSAHEDQRWSNGSMQFTELKDHATNVRESRQDLINRIGIDKNYIMPKRMDHILDDIFRKDIEDKPNHSKNNHGNFFYLNVYKILSRYTHGNINIFDVDDEALCNNIGLTAVYSTYYICLSFLHSADVFSKSEFDALETRVFSVINKEE